MSQLCGVVYNDELRYDAIAAHITAYRIQENTTSEFVFNWHHQNSNGCDDNAPRTGVAACVSLHRAASSYSLLCSSRGCFPIKIVTFCSVRYLDMQLYTYIYLCRRYMCEIYTDSDDCAPREVVRPRVYLRALAFAKHARTNQISARGRAAKVSCWQI